MEWKILATEIAYITHLAFLDEVYQARLIFSTNLETRNAHRLFELRKILFGLWA